MTHQDNDPLSLKQLAAVLDKTPAGITVIDNEGHILYYNEYCAAFVDRKPEYIGKNISFCHQKPESMLKIKKFLSELRDGQKKEYYYQAKRVENTLGVTVSPFLVEGKQIGFIQCFTILH